MSILVEHKNALWYICKFLLVWYRTKYEYTKPYVCLAQIIVSFIMSA